jgi:ATP-dependent Clp protease protease subunit
MIHRPPGGTSGQASDIDIQPKEINMMKKCQDEILVKHTGQPKEVIEKDTDRDFFLTGEEAVEYGLIDRTVR